MKNKLILAAAVALTVGMSGAFAAGRVKTGQVGTAGDQAGSRSEPARAYQDLLLEGETYSQVTSGGLEAEVFRLRQQLISMQERVVAMERANVERERALQAEVANNRREVENRLNHLSVQVQSAAIEIRNEFAGNGADSLRQEWAAMRAEFMAEIDSRYRQVLAAIQDGRPGDARASAAALRDAGTAATARIRVGTGATVSVPQTRVQYQYASTAPAVQGSVSPPPTPTVASYAEAPRAAPGRAPATNTSGIYEVRVRTASYDRAREIYQRLTLQGLSDLRLSASGEQFVIHLGRFRHPAYAQRRKEWAERVTGLGAEVGAPIS